MINTVILDAATLGSDIDIDCIKQFGNCTIYQNSPSNTVNSRISDADIVITNKVRLYGDDLQNTRVKLICIAATGYDIIDISYCRQHSIAVCNVPGYSTHSVAQLTVAMVTSLATKLYDYRQYVNSGAYSAGVSANHLEPPYHDICGKTWGVIGYGNIGKKVADIARAFGCNVLIFRATNKGVDGETDIDTLCRISDIISVHVPLNDGTRCLLNRTRIDSMKDGVILVNTARGAVADEGAITEAILNGKIGGFGCDVYTAEPFGAMHPYHRLLDKSNVCLTPHMAWGSVESRQRCLKMIEENIKAYLSGTDLHRIV